MEVWLHQHIFKVGWLVTNQYQTTTILYYAFFLPGILLNQLVYWAAAGFMNVRAERSIAWPEKQEIGELKLSFVQLSNTVGPIRLALISVTPLLAGLFVVAQIANNALNVPAFLTSMNSATASGDLVAKISRFTSASDFWIWFYLAFTISNTMIPRLQNLRGWRYIVGFFVIVVVALYAIGAGNQVIMDNLRGPVTDSLNALSSVFAIIIGFDIFMVAVLGTIEAIIERVTGDSATFENGKMVTMRRSEMLEMKRAKALAPQPKPAKPIRAPAGPPSVYKLSFPIPGAPGKEAVTHDEGIVISPDPARAQPAASRPDLRGPAVIPGSVSTEKLPASSSSPVISGGVAKPALVSPNATNPATTSSPPATTTPGLRPAASTITPANPAARPAFSSPPSTPASNTPGTRPTGVNPPTTPPGSRPSLSPSPVSTSSSTVTGTRPALPSTPASGAPPSTRPATPSTPVSGAPPGGRPAIPSTAGTSSNLPGARPAFSSTPASPLRSTTGSPLSPRPPATPIAKKPTDPFADEDEEDMDDVFEDIEDEEADEDDDEVNYEDFEDPA